MVSIPADIDLEDRILGGLTTRQVCILGGAAALLYLVWTLGGDRLPLPLFLALAAPLAAAAAGLALGRREGLSLDRWLWAAATHHAHTRRARTSGTGSDQPAAPSAGLVLPGLRRPAGPAGPRFATTGDGLVDLGAHGTAVLAVVSTVPLGLRSPAEQRALISTWAGYLHSLSDPVHLLVRSLPLDLSATLTRLRTATAVMPHPALAAAAADHAAHLAHLHTTATLIRRQVVLILRDPTRLTPPDDSGHDGRHAGGHSDGGHRAVAARLNRRVTDAAGLLAPAGVSVTRLDAAHAETVLASAYHPAGSPTASPTAPPSSPPGGHEPPEPPGLAEWSGGWQPGGGAGLDDVDESFYPLPIPGQVTR
jgi:hypothetical protein